MTRVVWGGGGGGGRGEERRDGGGGRREESEWEKRSHVQPTGLQFHLPLLDKKKKKKEENEFPPLPPAIPLPSPANHGDSAGRMLVKIFPDTYEILS